MKLVIYNLLILILIPVFTLRIFFKSFTTTRKIIDATNANLLFINSYYKNKTLVLQIESIDHVGLNSIKLAQKINNLMEEKILQHPAEYLWMHRRFKSTLGKNFYK